MNEKKIQADINAFGWSIMAIEGTDYLPSFAHTIGLWEQYKHPEIIIFGLAPVMMQNILNEAGTLIKSGRKFEPNLSYNDFFENGLASCIAVDNRNILDYFGYAINYYQHQNFDAVELVWTDRNYKFPWDAGFEEEFKFKQPLLDRNVDFKFNEEKDLNVWTSKDNKQEILMVTHDAEGNWHFLSRSDDTDLIESTLCELILQDRSLNDLFDLDYGQMAVRKSKDDKWERTLI